MICSRCGADFTAPPQPGRVPWCPACVAKLCCSKSASCAHRSKPYRVRPFGRAAIAAAALMLSTACTTAGGGGVPEASASAPRASSVPDRTRLAPEYERVTSSTVHASPPRASRSRAAGRVATPPVARPAPIQVSGDIYDALARCESGMNPRTNTGNGFYGAFQFMLSTWHRFRPGNPIDYSYAEQRAVVVQFFPISSWRTQFPHCARKLGVA